MSPAHGHHTPPSAAGFLEPYAARIWIEPNPPYLEAAPLLRSLLEGLAAACDAEGATLIGHIKCFLSVGESQCSCNLTSRRTGAHCHSSVRGALLIDRPAELSLAVLVYGLAASTIGGLARGVLDRLLLPAGAPWRLV